VASDTAQVQHQPAHGVRGIAAIAVEIRESLVTQGGLVLHEGVDQVVERLAREIVLPDGSGQRRHHRMDCFAALVKASRFPAPPIEQA
jgi:hypothetical protein